MSRYTQYNKNDTYRENLNYANLQKERRANEELKEIERDRIAMERLKIQLDQEKQYEKERKIQIRQQQYEDYSNYMRQKLLETPQNREKLNIKVGGEKRIIRRPSYNQQMDNLCLNPTRQQNVYPMEPVKNFSEAGRNYQRGYSHGYNILTGELYSQTQTRGKTPKNININNNMNRVIGDNREQQERMAKTEFSKENQNQNLDKEKDDLSKYQAYMEMKRQKEKEEFYYMQQQQKENINKEAQLNQNIQNENPEQTGPSLNEISPEYKEMYIKQQIQQQKQQEELQRQEPEIPPQYRDMFMRQQMQQLEKPKERGANSNQPQNEKMPNEYADIMLKQSSENKGRSTPYNTKLNNLNHQSYHNVPQQNSENHNERVLEKDENMEIYQNMLREKEKEQLEREQYQQYLINQQNQDIRQPNMNQMMENNNMQYPYQYGEESNIKNDVNKITETQKQMINKDTNEDKYGNYPPNEVQKDYIPQEQGVDEEYMMYQQQKQMQEMEEREKASQILESKQMEKMNANNINQNEYYQEESSSVPYNPSINSQIPERMSEFNSAKMEYLQNKQKNMLSKDNIFSYSEAPKQAPKYNNEPLTKTERLRIQREYAQFLDAQINAKNIKNKIKNNGLGPVQSTGYEVGGPNPYQKLRDKHDRLKDIPQDPYSTKNYNICNNTYLISNPITNPVSSYKFVDRRKNSSGRLLNNGNNIVGK